MADVAALEVLRAKFVAASDGSRSRRLRELLLAELYPTLDAAGFGEARAARWFRLDTAVPRRPAASGRGYVVLTNTSNVAHSFAAGELVVLHASTSKRYRSLLAGSLPAVGELRAVVEAEEPGETSTAAAGTLTVLETPLSGVTVTNPRTIAGHDADTESDYVRAQLSGDGLSLLAREVRRADGTLVGAGRVRLVDGVVYVASADGAPLSAGDLALFDTPQITERGKYSLANATGTAIAVTYSLDVDASHPETPATDAEITDAIEARLEEHLATIPFAGTVYADALDTTMRAALGVRVGTEAVTSVPWLLSLTVSAPASDTVLGATAVPTLGAVTPTINRI